MELNVKLLKCTVIVLAALLLRPFKSLMFALQWKHNAAESRWDGVTTLTCVSGRCRP